MKTKIIIILLLFLSATNTWSQTLFSENIGTPTATTTITANTFQNSSTLAYSNGAQTNAADIRNTNASSGYTGASGGGNVYFTSTSGAYGFSIEGINASNYNSLTLQYAYRKEAAGALATFSVEYWNGTSWVTLANTSANLFNEASTATATWYLAKTLLLPTEAQINGLKIRFVKTGTVAIRIDDIKLTGMETLPTVTNAEALNITSNAATFGGTVSATGGSSITATGIVYASTTINTNPTLGGLGVTQLATTNPNTGTGSFTNTSTSLAPNVQYTYNVYATKATGTTGYGTAKTFYTLAATPTAPTATALSASKVNITIGNDTNAALTVYAIKETNSGNYVQSDGTLAPTAYYQTKALWGTKTVSGLSATTTYTFQVIAKNGSGIITANSPATNVTTLQAAVITTAGTLNALTTVYGTASTFTSFTLNGSNITDAVVITPPNGFEVSMMAGGTGGYANSLTLNPVSGSITTTTIYVRLSASANSGTYNGTITLASANDGITAAIATSTSSVTKVNVTLSGITINNKPYDGTTAATWQGTPTLNGILASDSQNVTLNSASVVANFTDAAIGTAKSVTVSGFTLNGTAAVNYSIVQPTGLYANIMPNSGSDIIYNNTSSTNTNANIDYRPYQGTTLTSTSTGANGSIGVFGFYLRDGGSGLNDADNLSTELTEITFSITNPEAIKSARLFVGTSSRGVAVAVNGASSVTFSGLTNIVAPDNEQLAVHLRVTFNASVTDNQQFQFAVTSATAKATGSTFSAPNAGGAMSSTAGDVNRIEVTADRLAFVQQPTNKYATVNMNPSPSVEATDANGNRDLDFTGEVSLTSTGTINAGTLVVNAVNGLASFSNLNHTVTGTGLTLTAAATGMTSALSSTFTIIDLQIPTFNAVAPICSGGTLNSLPTTSLEGITGTWSPALNNTATTTYLFTPSAGQNAVGVALNIVVKPIDTPTFNAVAPIPYGSSLTLPSLSNNGFYGTWAPAIDNTATTTYTFTPNTGQCATTATRTVVVIPPAATTVGSVINSIHKITYKVPTTNSSTSYAPNEVVESVTYYDGLGRPIQQKTLKQSNTGKDIVVPIEYDIFGRQPKDYLPYVNSGTNPDYESNALTDQAVFYSSQGANFENTAYPYSQKTFENDALNRIIKVSAPGEDWRTQSSGPDNTVKIDYQTNGSNEVKLFQSASDETTFAVSLIDNGAYYQAGELYKTTTKNENWKVSDITRNTTEEFKDKEGRIILKRAYGSSIVNGVLLYETHDTYYVYDQFSNLTFVIPPKVDVTTTISQTIMNNLCYQYKYDSRNRLIEKKLPGKDWEYIVYDKLDRVVATGPALSPFKDATGSEIGWKITKYDAFNRIITTGWMQVSSLGSTARSTLQATVNAATNFSETTSGTGYTNTAWPTSGYEPLTLNYYDNYNGTISFTTTSFPFVTNGYNNTTAQPKGLPTLSWVRVLENKTDMRAERTFIIYDQKARAITSFSNNYLDGYTRVDHQMELMTGRINQSVLKHKRTSTDTEIVVTNTFSYTDQDRLIKQTHQIGNGVPQLMSLNEYSELGQLTVKRVGSKTSGDVNGLQKIDYSYNARGWLKGINDITNLYGATENDLFAYKLNYNTTDNSTTQKQYNGNISEVQWRTATDNTVKQYSYSYDELNRMKTAVYTKPIPNTVTTSSNDFGENAWYDKNGNITHLDRYTGGSAPTNQIDDLTYTYASNSNQLMSVTDAQPNTEGFSDGNTTGDDYSYDAYGNVIIDKNKNIINPSNPSQQAIAYNHLNLPTKIVFGNSDTIEYLYNAVGKKLQKKVTQGTVVTTTDYLDGFQYQNNVLLFSATSQGYVKANGTYVFQYKDHLGNVRVSYTNNNGVAQILEENNYYPFGLRQNDNTNVATDNKYKYNGKELQDELGLNMTAMDFRQYDNALGRFNVIDPLAEQDFSRSVYCFAGNNPVLYGDPSGLKAVAPQEAVENHIVPGSVLAMYANGMSGSEITQYLMGQMWGPSSGGGGGGGGGSGGSGGSGGGSDTPTQAEIISILASVGINATVNSEGEIGFWNKHLEGFGSDSGSFYDTGVKDLLGYSGSEIELRWVKTWVPVGEGEDLFGSTITNKLSYEKEWETIFGDKIIISNYTGKIIGKEGSIGTFDFSHANGKFEGASVSILKFINLGINSDASISLGLGAFGHEVHIGVGIGNGFGQISFGGSYSNNGTIMGSDTTVQVGFGTAAIIAIGMSIESIGALMSVGL